ncbi:alkene reductase [Sphingomonas sp. HDW15A]|uniref:alkene reductase n=1 Tax=Sphingomonas sp. HDW15A TaxID=2714942 RepID=UPI001409EA93|nr:alkene reductase [Sphingomonas sp. HDW15A]QIK97294.1 alkene reductase [Sphingomonas sp. HDW15A]
MPSLFDPIDLTPALYLPNRILMAPLTRGRATREAVPTPIMAEYYSQRADAGLIISEATGISREGLGWPGAPGIWNHAQVEGWKPVTEAVHKRGGRMVLQLWHMGRMVHSAVTHERPLAPSAITPPGEAHSYEGKRPFEQPRQATSEDIARVLDDYGRAARNAIAAGFDGIQIHGANGYLIDEFLRSSSNHRSDDYGGPIANRVRFLREVAERIVSEIGADRVGVRMSPNGAVNGCDDPDHIALFTAAAAELERVGIPWIELREPGPQSTFRATDQQPASPSMRRVFSGKIVLNSDYKLESAQARLDEGIADAISFGRTFIANPDLVERLRAGAELNRWDVDTFYTSGPQGYVDYPKLGQAA